MQLAFDGVGVESRQRGLAAEHLNVAMQPQPGVGGIQPYFKPNNVQ